MGYWARYFSVIKGSMSDLLCKVVTDASYSRRALYANDDMIANYNRIVHMNGVNLPVDKTDLLDRCCLISLDRIIDKRRKDEGTLEKEFNMIRGEILGGCCDILAKAMKIFYECPKFFRRRMADYARWGCAIALSMEYSVDDFECAINKNASRQTEEGLEASPFATILLHYRARMNVPTLTGVPTYILKELREVMDTSGGQHDIIIDKQAPQLVKASFDLKGTCNRIKHLQALFSGGWLRCSHPECGLQIVCDPKEKKNTVRHFDYYRCANSRGKLHKSLKYVNERHLWE